MSEQHKIDYLTEDEPILGQKYVLLSMVTPELVKNCTVRGIKIRGVFGNEDNARAKALELQKIDPLHNIYVAEMGKWLPWNDDPAKAQDEEYAEGELNRIMKGLKENQIKSKMLHEQRKNDLIQKTLEEQDKRKTDNSSGKTPVVSKPTGQIEMEEVSANVVNNVNKDYNKLYSKEELDNKEGELNNSKKVLDQEQENLDKDTEIMKEKETNINNINDELKKAEELYQQLSSQ